MIKIKTDNPHLFEVPDAKIVTGRTDFVVDKCKNKKVLHLGCVDEGFTEDRIETGNLLHLQLMQVSKQVWGLDISAKGLKLLKNAGIDDLILGNVEHLDTIDELSDLKFDIIVASEIIEHLNNTGQFLQSVKQLFSSDTEMILTTPNAHRFIEISYNLKKYEFVHPDHNCWFSWKTLSTLLNKHGFVVNEILVYDIYDFKESIYKRITKNIFKKKSNRESAVKNINNKHKSSIGGNFNKLVHFAIKKYLCKRNPFFADGLIFVVNLNESRASE